MTCWHDIPNSSMLYTAGKIARFSFTFEKVNKTDSLQPSRSRGAVEENPCMTPLHFLDFVAINVATRTTHSFSRKIITRKS